MTAYDTAARPTWREEARRDREARARLDIERDAARRAARSAERDAADARKAKLDAARRKARADAADVLGKWVTGHVTDLLFVPVIGVPAALAWTAMSAYGAHLYGTPGRALPAFSEGAMWAFAAAVTINRHRHPDRPVWHLRLGTLVFALFGAVLNFAHGLTLGGPVTGVVMALISIAGVTAHQLTKAGPRHARRGRRTRADRDAEHIARLAAKRVRKARAEAVKAAAIELAEDGTARLAFTAVIAEPDPAEAPKADNPPSAKPASERPRKRTAADKPAGRGGDTADRIARLRAKQPDISTADIAARLGISPRTVRRYPPATQTSAGKD